MRATQYPSKRLLPLFHKQKIATLSELKATLGSKCTMTVFRKLSELTYITSCSHGGSYYSLKRIARFDHRGLWIFDSVVFSSVGTLAATLTRLVERSDEGLSAKEIHELLGINPNAALLALLSQKKITREKISGVFVYFSLANATRKKQELHRKGSVDRIDAIRLVPEILLNELKAAIILFYSTLDEQQRRLYAGLESLKVGAGGDQEIADLLAINKKTVVKGRKQLLERNIRAGEIRRKGAGRKAAEKKNPRRDTGDRRVDEG